MRNPQGDALRCAVFIDQIGVLNQIAHDNGSHPNTRLIEVVECFTNSQTFASSIAGFAALPLAPNVVTDASATRDNGITVLIGGSTAETRRRERFSQLSRTGHCTQNPAGHFECNGDITPIIGLLNVFPFVRVDDSLERS
jgi:hypothetical protein